jgi:NTE family protein
MTQQWCRKAACDDRNAPPMLNAFTKAISRYHDGEIHYF